MASFAPAEAAAPQGDPFPLLGIDHLELWVGNAAQAAFFLEHAFGFHHVAYAGLETGLRDRASHVLVQGTVRLVVTGTLRGDTPVAAHHARHGDGVKVIALAVPDAARAYADALARGATGIAEPARAADEDGTVRTATIAAYGETVHTFVERDGYAGAFLPGYAAVEPAGPRGAAGGPVFEDLDHVVANVEAGRMDHWVGFYADVLGMAQMRHFSDEAIATEHSALMSKVMADGTGRIKLPVNEPAPGRRRSQVDEFLEFNEGPGAQHIALTTRDIVATVEHLRVRGVTFLPTPDAYYDDLPARVGPIDESLEDLHRLGILVDRDDEGYLLQVFTRPLGDRPTVFFEIIQRRGARGFGAGNFKALFEALEREQDRRGNL
ncbi:MAG: 4-hydroxyphenylpyruvate dioxygenase [Solirubrobacteraceae bacterium MAG38_C4-C5]|nr:4-hydroxyphenylpyruvate dioxygenase [Candidatus Siliceabacter maunaloa]